VERVGLSYKGTAGKRREKKSKVDGFSITGLIRKFCLMGGDNYSGVLSKYDIGKETAQ